MLTRWNPFDVSNGAVALGPLMTREFDQFFRELAVPGSRQGGTRELAPPTDIYETAEGLTLQVDLPGHQPDAIEVKVENDTLSIRAERKAEGADRENARRLERRFGVYARSFVVPRTVDASRVEARYEHGVLTLTLPRREEAKPRTVQVKVNG
ncbi:MAG TPA: Hsp20/alpha crystallin family protein [Myxococcaceae bacterium]|nr:Hsp20/alpha crystallin family protein [Myxococcaceae bacterium]